MNTKIALIIIGVSSMATWNLMSQPPVVVVSPVAPAMEVPAPARVTVTAETTVPDSYVWDGYEYVGIIGSHYYFLGPGNVWQSLDGSRLARFHGWEKVNGGWQDHAIRNENYRHDAHGHLVPLHVDRSHDADRHDH
jgi:hypothetical protein